MRWIILSVAVVLAWAATAAWGQQKPELWLYYGTNFQVNKNVDELEKVWRRAAAAGYTHVMLTDSKFAKLGDLGEMTKVYVANLQRAQRLAAELKLQLVPCLFDIGYSNSLLWHDPNLAEGLPVKDQLFIVSGGAARLEPDPPVKFGKMAFHDESVHIDGTVASVADPAGNARFVYKLTVPRFRCYHIAVSIKTSGFSGEPRIEVLAGGRLLQYQSLGVKPTQDWTVTHVVFNSLDNPEVSVYFGVWGGARGSLQWRDWKIEEVGLLNVLRRPGAPCVVKEETSGRVLSEGRDYEAIADPRMGNVPWNGEYEVYHESPAIRTRMADGSRLRVSWYHPAIIYDGQVAACISEPKTLELLADEARRMKSAFGPAASGYMMSFDEMRVGNWDEACQSRRLDAGAELAECARYCTKLLAPATAYVWSDMFDPNHNAVKDYYLVRGDLAGSWEGLDKRVIVVNWNFEHRDASLKFFADRGHRQLIAGYYDGPVEGSTRAWLESARRVSGVIGIMYTTWRNNYGDLENFAKSARW